jgi:predicted Fe-Mo cluster-binding NifX family protein
MKIAVPVTEFNQVDNHFGHCNFYNVFSVTGGIVTDIKRVPSPQGCGCKSNIAELLAADGVKVMLAGGIGNGAINVLQNSGIAVVRGCSGDSLELVNLYNSGDLTDSGESCHHHDHHQAEESGHQCSH